MGEMLFGQTVCVDQLYDNASCLVLNFYFCALFLHNLFHIPAFQLSQLPLM